MCGIGAGGGEGEGEEGEKDGEEPKSCIQIF